MLIKRKVKSAILKKVCLLKKTRVFNKHFQTTNSCSLKEVYIKKELSEVEDSLKLRKQKKKKILNIVLLLVNFAIITGILVYYGLTSGIKSFSDLISSGVRFKFLILAALMFLISTFIEGLRYYQLIRKSTGKKSYSLALNTHMRGRYYDCITPFAVGGQPFQIFYLNKHGVPGEKATAIPLVEHFFSSITFVIIGIVVLIVNFAFPVTTNPFIIVLASLGIIANGGVIALVALLSISKRIGPAFVIKILKLLNKMHIIKNYKKTFFKVSRFVKSYQKSMKDFSKHIPTVLFQLISALISYLSMYAIVYFICLAFIPTDVTITVGSGILNYKKIIGLMTMCDLCTGIMPLPGGTGLAEISFDALFMQWFDKQIFPWAMLSWRTLTYFIFIIVGGIQIFCSFIKGNRKKKFQKDVNLTDT